MLYLSTSVKECLDFYRQHFLNDILIDDASYIVLSDDAESEVSEMGRIAGVDYILVDMSTSGEMIETGRLEFTHTMPNQTPWVVTQPEQSERSERSERSENVYSIADALSEIFPSREQIVYALSETVDHGRSIGPLTRSDARNASAILLSMKSILGPRFFEGEFENRTIEMIKSRVHRNEIESVNSFIESKQKIIDFDSQLLESAHAEVARYERTFNEQLEIAVAEFIERFTESYKQQLPPVTVESVVSRPENVTERKRLDDASEDALDVAQNDVFIQMLADDAPASKAMFKYMSLKNQLEANFLETLKEEQSQLSQPKVVHTSSEQFVDYLVQQDEISHIEQVEESPVEVEESPIEEEVESPVEVEESQVEEEVEESPIEEEEAVSQHSIMDDLIALSEPVEQIDVPDEDVVHTESDETLDPEDINLEEVDIFEGVELNETEVKVDEESPVEVPSFDSVVDSAPIESSSKSGTGKTVAAVSAAALLLGATAFGVTGFVYPGFMLNDHSPQSDSHVSGSQSSESSQSDSRSGIQKNFQVGDHLEVVGGDKEYSVTIDRFNDSGAIAKDTSGEEWFISNALLEKWVAEHPERFSSVE